MSRNAVQEEVRRFEDKSLDGQLLWELQNGFELARVKARGLWMR